MGPLPQNRRWAIWQEGKGGRSYLSNSLSGLSSNFGKAADSWKRPGPILSQPLSPWAYARRGAALSIPRQLDRFRVRNLTTLFILLGDDFSLVAERPESTRALAVLASGRIEFSGRSIAFRNRAIGRDRGDASLGSCRKGLSRRQPRGPHRGRLPPVGRSRPLPRPRERLPDQVTVPLRKRMEP